MKLVKSIALLSMLVYSGAACAQDRGPGGAGQAAAPTAPQQRSQKSLGCSKQADSQNLHGKPRREFMRKCKNG